MDLAQYRSAVEGIPYGKRLPNSLYVYRPDQPEFGPELNALLAHLIGQFQIGPEFNVVKFRSDELNLSFLSYPTFFEIGHPALRHSLRVPVPSWNSRARSRCA